MGITLEELKTRIVNTYDPDLVVEQLEITTEELLDKFEEKLVQYKFKFKDLYDENSDDGEDANGNY